jgi:sugar lactone lactonase YvrE
MRPKAVIVLFVFAFIAVKPQHVHLAWPGGPATPTPLIPATVPIPIPSPGYQVERIYTPVIQFPESIAVSPSGIIAVFEVCGENTGHRVIRVHEDGNLSTYGQVIEKCYRAITFDAASNLYAVDHDGALYRTTPEGETALVATGVVVGDLAAAPSGDIFAGGGGTIQCITPQGQVSIYASGSFYVKDIDVNPISGDLYMSDSLAGVIYRVKSDGTTEVLSSGFLPEPNFPFIAFAGDGTLYLNTDFEGFFVVSLVDGTLTEIPWLRSSVLAGHPRNIDVDSQGRVIAVEHGFGHVFRFDMASETLDVVYQNIGNSTALAVAPNGGGVYMGVSHPSKTGTGRVVRIEADGSLTTVLDGLPPRVRRMAFDADGLGFIATQNPIVSWDTIIYTATLDGVTQELITYSGSPASLAVDPTTGYLWGSEWNELWYVDEAGIRHSIPYTITDETRPKPDPMLAITPDGTIYTRYTGPQGDIPVEQGIYRVDPTGPTNELVADLSSLNLCCVGGIITAGSDGNIYWIGDGDRFSPDHKYDFYLLRITPSGEVTLLARNLALDTFAIASDPDSTDLYFTSGEGVWRVLKVENIFLPLVLRDNN